MNLPIDKISNSIPKVIHYCWFGGNPLPEPANTCIASWRKYLPGFEIKEWNESNFDLNSCSYVREAYHERMWAFVSDYARFKILYEMGGLYFDTDVELIKSIEDILKNGSFMGSEASVPERTTKGERLIATGLGLAAVPGLSMYKEILNSYEASHFISADGIMDSTTVVSRVTDIMAKYGYDSSKTSIQVINNIRIYPPDFFCPLNYYTGELQITDNTRSIHHYSETWHNPLEKKVEHLRRVFARAGKKDTLAEKIVIYPLIVMNSIRKYGMIKTCRQITRKMK